MNIIKGITNSCFGFARALLSNLTAPRPGIVQVFQPAPAPKPHIPVDLAARFPVKRRPSRDDPNAIIRAAKRRERRSILRARNIVRGWVGTYKTPPESIRHLATP